MSVMPALADLAVWHRFARAVLAIYDDYPTDANNPPTLVLPLFRQHSSSNTDLRSMFGNFAGSVRIMFGVGRLLTTEPYIINTLPVTQSQSFHRIFPMAQQLFRTSLTVAAVVQIGKQRRMPRYLPLNVDVVETEPTGRACKSHAGLACPPYPFATSRLKVTTR